MGEKRREKLARREKRKIKKEEGKQKPKNDEWKILEIEKLLKHMVNTNILDHPDQEKISHLIVTEPGPHIIESEDRFKIFLGFYSYHNEAKNYRSHNLENYGFIKSEILKELMKVPIELWSDTRSKGLSLISPFREAGEILAEALGDRNIEYGEFE